MELVTLTINGTQVKAKAGTPILWAALDNGIYIPHLCAIRGRKPPFAGCRLCLVEIEGESRLATACSEPVVEGMRVDSETPRVKRVRNTAFQLILSNHPIVCSKCFKNSICELQELAVRLGGKLKQRRFRHLSRNYPVDDTHPLFIYDPNLCVLCDKCVWVCNKWGDGTLTLAFRGMETRVSTFSGISLKEADCISCGECVATCPVGALVPKTIKVLKESRRDRPAISTPSSSVIQEQ